MLRLLQMAFLGVYISKNFRGGMPPDPPSRSNAFGARLHDHSHDAGFATEWNLKLMQLCALYHKTTSLSMYYVFQIFFYLRKKTKTIYDSKPSIPLTLAHRVHTAYPRHVTSLRWNWPVHYNLFEVPCHPNGLASRVL